MSEENRPICRVKSASGGFWELEFEAHPVFAGACELVNNLGAVWVQGLTWRVFRPLPEITEALGRYFQVSRVADRPRVKVRRRGSMNWELQFDIAPTGEGLRALRNIHADAIDLGPLYKLWYVSNVMRPDLDVLLQGYFDATFDETAEEPKAKMDLGPVRLWQVGKVWHVMLLGRDADYKDETIFQLVFPGSRKVAPAEFVFEQTLGNILDREHVVEILSAFYKVHQVETPPERDAGSERMRREVYERWCETLGVEPPDGWQTRTSSRGYSGFKQSYENARQYTPPPRRQESGDPYRALLEGLPPELLKKVYRLIAGECHPDKGGSTEKMQRVNAAWDRIKKLAGL